MAFLNEIVAVHLFIEFNLNFFYILSKDVIHELDIFLIYNRNVDHNEICWKNDTIFVTTFVIVVMYSLALISKYGVNQIMVIIIIVIIIIYIIIIYNSD